MFRRLRDAKLKINPEKYRFCVDNLRYLGHIVDRESIRTDPDKVKAIREWPAPKTIKHIRQFLDVASWYHRFIQDFATIATPLIVLTRKNAKWKWRPDEHTFQKLKNTLIIAPVLACPDFAR